MEEVRYICGETKAVKVFSNLVEILKLEQHWFCAPELGRSFSWFVAGVGECWLVLGWEQRPSNKESLYWSVAYDLEMQLMEIEECSSGRRPTWHVFCVLPSLGHNHIINPEACPETKCALASFDVKAPCCFVLLLLDACENSRINQSCY